MAEATIRRTRPASFSFAATTSTMRFPYVFPSRIIETVEIVLSTSFCAVPAFRRVDPARNSGPTTTTISCSTSDPSCDPAAETTQAVRAPASAAVSSAPTTYGVAPLALIPTTASAGVGASASRSAAPASRSSSAVAWTSAAASSPPATMATTVSGGVEKVATHSEASRAAIRPEDPAPTYTSRPPARRRSEMSSTARAMAGAAASTAAGTVASAAFISPTSSRVGLAS